MKKPADFSVYKFDEGVFVKLGKNTVKSRGFKRRKCAISRKIGIIAKHHYARFCKGIAAASVTFRGKRATAAQATDFLLHKKAGTSFTCSGVSPGTKKDATHFFVLRLEPTQFLH